MCSLPIIAISLPFYFDRAKMDLSITLEETV